MDSESETPEEKKGLSGLGPADSWEPPSRSNKPWRRWPTIVVVLVVIILVLVGVYTSGVIPGFGVHKGPSGPDLTYSDAQPIAAGAASSHANSPHLGFALAVRSPVTYRTTLANLTGLSCLPSGGTETAVVIPSFNGSYTSGESSSWFFEFWQSSPPDIVLVGVLNGSAVYFGLITPAVACGASFISQNTVPGGVIDSPSAAAAGGTNGTMFAAAHPEAIAVFAILGGNTSNPALAHNPQWRVDYSTCVLGSNSNGSAFRVSVDATSGHVVGVPSTQSTACQASTPLLGLAGPLPVSLAVPGPTITLGRGA